MVGPDSSYSPLEIHMLEGTEGREDGASDPHRILALRGRNHLDLHGGWCQSSELLGHALTNACKHGGSARQHHIAVEILTDVNVALHDGLEGGVMNAAGLLAHEAGLEEHLRAAEALASDGDDVAIWQLIGLLLIGALRCLLHLSIEVQGDV